MFGIGGAELLVVFVFALLFIGPKKLPELARGLGKGIREFQKAKDDLFDQVNTPSNDQDKTQNVSNDNAASEVIAETSDNKKTSENSNA